MEEIANPYIAGSPVTGRAMFYGREDVFDFVRRTLSGRLRDQVIVLYGQRRTGKTSILYQMHRYLDESYIPILIDLHGLELKSLAGFLWEMANHIRRQLRRQYDIELPSLDRAGFMADPRNQFEGDFLGQVWQTIGNRNLLLMLDEAVRLQEQVQAGVLEQGVFEYLRHLMQHYNRLNFLFSLGSGLEEMERQYALLFNVALYKKISFLEEGAAVRLIIEPVRNYYRLQPEAIARILAVTAGHPYFTQLVCHSIFSRWQQQGGTTVEAADVEATLDEVVERGLAVLKYVWEESTPAEKAVMAGIAAATGEKNRPVKESEISQAWRKLGVNIPPGEMATAIRSLIARDVIAGEERYRFTIDLQYRWVRKYERLAWVKEEIAQSIEAWPPVLAKEPSSPSPIAGSPIRVALLIFLLSLCCVSIPLCSLLVWPEVRSTLLVTDTPTPTNTPESTQTPTPTVDIGATQTATRNIWLEQDDDGDGLLNGEELANGTLPLASDTDGDGLSDFDELIKHGTDPTNRDTDGDGLPDGQEADNVCLSPTTPDTDLDGMPDNIDPDSCTGITPTPSPVPEFALGGQVNNTDEHLDILEDARMSWVKLQLRYGIGDDASAVLQDVARFKEQGYRVLLNVTGNVEELESEGYTYYQTFAEFLGELAPLADGIEVWTEPNIQNNWPDGELNPFGYRDMLRFAYLAIKDANPNTLVISAAPAPTGVNNESAMSDDRYIQGMVAAGAHDYIDCVGLHYIAGATSPSATSGHPADSTGHYVYYFLPMMDLYYDTFNPSDSISALPLCFTEIGYLSDDGFDQTLAQAGATNFLWAEGNSVRDQAEWLEEALLRSCRSGKVKLFMVWNVDFEDYGEDPQAGYSILRPDDSCPSCQTLSRAVGILRNEGCMQ